MNEGWACTIHHKIINELNLPDNLHLPFIKLHNQVIRPHLGQINPYHLGFKMFEMLIEKHGFEEAKILREIHNDITFLRCYLDRDFMNEMIHSIQNNNISRFRKKYSEKYSWFN